jgi:heme oxygenase
MLHEELKKRTSDAHQALETKLLTVIRNIKSTGDYVRFLKLMYGYYAAIEERLSDYVPHMGIANRRTSGRLLNDIRNYETSSEVSLCTDLPLIDSFPAALGSMYVVEGSTMGGPIIARMIATQLGLNDNTTLTFFSGHPGTYQSWNAFKENFARPFAENEKHSLIHTANHTFFTFSNWIDQHARN